jgi:hypothetical protein
MMLIKLRFLGLVGCVFTQFAGLLAGCSFSVPLRPVMVDIRGIDKAILIGLLCNSVCHNMPRKDEIGLVGSMRGTREAITHDAAIDLLKTTGGKFEITSGISKVKIDVSGDMMDVAAYNKFCGAGGRLAEKIIDGYKAGFRID